MYLRGDDGFFDQYQWLNDYFRRFRDSWLSNSLWRLLELKQKLQMQPWFYELWQMSRSSLIVYRRGWRKTGLHSLSWMRLKLLQGYSLCIRKFLPALFPHWVEGNSMVVTCRFDARTKSAINQHATARTKIPTGFRLQRAPLASNKSPKKCNFFLSATGNW